MRIIFHASESCSRVPATFDSQAVRNSTSWALTVAWLRLTYRRHSDIRKSVFIFHERHNHGWHVFPIFDSKLVRIRISWAGPSWLTCFAIFDYQDVCVYISLATQSRLTCPCHFWLSAGSYFHSISCNITTDMFPSLSTLRQCVIPFIHGITICNFLLPFSIIRKCVSPFHELHNQSNKVFYFSLILASPNHPMMNTGDESSITML